MILADKIVELRKKNQWSQEELASQLGVSRQAISKWETAQSVPDLTRILQMSRLFGVSTDWLLNDEMGLPSESLLSSDLGEADSEHASLRVLTLEEAQAYLHQREKSTKPIAFGVALCIASLIPPILSDTFPNPSVAEPLSAILMLLIVLGAVGLFVANGLPLRAWHWIDVEPFETAYGVSGVVREKQKALQPQLITHLVIGISLCILALIFLVASDLHLWLHLPSSFFPAMAFALVAPAVYLFITVGFPYYTYQRLLQEGDYRPKKKVSSKKTDALMGIYWLLVLAIYLAYSFLTLDWERSWIRVCGKKSVN